MSTLKTINDYPEGLDVQDRKFPINYCPTCGRKLVDLKMPAQELIQAVARVWVTGGGSAEGLDGCLPNLKNAVNELIKNQEEEK